MFVRLQFLCQNMKHFEANPREMESNFTDNVTTFRMVFWRLELIFRCRKCYRYYEIRQFTSKIFESESSNRQSQPTKLYSPFELMKKL